MREYSEGVAGDGVAILCGGVPLTTEQILVRLRALENVMAVVCDAPELDPCNYTHNQVCQLNTAMCEAWSIINIDD